MVAFMQSRMNHMVVLYRKAQVWLNNQYIFKQQQVQLIGSGKTASMSGSFSIGLILIHILIHIPIL